MPKTCNKTNVSKFRPPVKPSCKMPNVILLLFSHYHCTLLKSLVAMSIQSISDSFFAGKLTPELSKLQDSTHTASHIELLGIFFLLLNVDQTLKKEIMRMEMEANYPKLERFLLDLRRSIVVEFAINEQISLQLFVDNCEEHWVLA